MGGGKAIVKRTVLNVFSISIFSALGLLWFPHVAHGGGTVVAWGGENVGQLDPCAEDVVAIATGYEQTLLLRRDGTVANCGMHYDPQPPYVTFAYPITVPEGLSNVIAVAGGSAHSLALKADGTIVAWGRNSYGQTNVPSDLTNVVAISSHLALKADGTVVSWGPEGSYIVFTGLTNVVAVASGTSFALALKADGTVAGWPTNANDWWIANLTADLAGLTNVVAISAGFYEWLALKADGTVAGQSRNFGVPSNLTNVVTIAASTGNDHHISLAVKADGTVIGWGFNFYGWNTGKPMVPPGLTNVVAVSGDSTHNLALIGDGPPELQVPVTNPTWESNRFRVSVPTQSGKVYRLEYKGSLEETSWTALPLVAGNGGIRTLDDPTATGTQRFYRVRHW